MLNQISHDPVHDEKRNYLTPVKTTIKTDDEVKRETLNALLAKINKVDLEEVCLLLGWQPCYDKEGERKPPQQKHFKVAIVHELMRTAKENNWHLIKDTGFCYVYNTELWIVLTKDELQNLLKDAAIKLGYPVIESRDSRFINSLYEQQLQDGFFIDKRLVKQSMINLQNGTLVLHSEGVTIKSFDHRDFLTHQLLFNHQPGVKNIVFLDYLNDVLPDHDTQKTLQEVIGYLFVKGLKLEKIFFLYGSGANGKSVIFEVLNGLLGQQNISNYSLEALTDDKGYFRANIKDKIVNYASDIKLSRIDAGLFKTLASGEPIEARLPYGQPFILRDYAKLIFNLNRLDNANIEHTHGFYRRILIIPFNRVLAESEQDKHLHKKILRNKAGVLNWIIEGSERVIANQSIFESKECLDFKSKFIRETDSVAMFVSECYIKNLESKTTLHTLYHDYKEFCIETNYKPLGRNNFSKRLEAIGFQRNADMYGVYFNVFKNRVKT